MVSFSQYTGTVGNDFQNILQTQNFAMKERTNCEKSHIREEQVNHWGLIYSENSMRKYKKYCMFRATYGVTVLKKGYRYDDAKCVNEKHK